MLGYHSHSDARHHGLGRLELVVLLAVSASAALLFFGLNNKVTPKVREVGDIANLKEIGQALTQYAQDHEGNFPVSYTLAGNVVKAPATPITVDSNEAFRALFATGVVKEEALFYIPGNPYFKKGDEKIGSKADGFLGALDTRENSYAYLVGVRLKSDPLTPVAWDPPQGQTSFTVQEGWVSRHMYPKLNEGRGLNVLRRDGSVEYVTEDEDGRVKIGGAGPFDPTLYAVNPRL